MLCNVHMWRRSVLLRLLVATVGGLLLATGPARAASGPISLVKSFSAGTRDSNPGQIVVAGGVGYFAADPTGRGLGDSDWNELFATDGTEAGTRLVKELVPGDEGADPQRLTAVGDTLYFETSGGHLTEQLWQTDGTAAGTVPVAFPNAGAQGSKTIAGVRDGQLLVVTDLGLWALKYGTEPRHIASLPNGHASDFTLLDDGRLAFRVRTSMSAVDAQELWITATTGDAEPKRLARFEQPQSFGALSASGNTLYFPAAATGTGTEPWVSDGTAAGTKMLADLGPGETSSFPGWSASLGDDAFVTTSPAGLVRIGSGQVTALHPTGSERPFAVRSRLTVVGTRLCFLADSGTTPDAALWCTDGTQAGTAQISSGEGSAAAVRSVQLIGTTLYFAVDGQIWQTDGTTAGTRRYAAVPTSAPPFGADGFAQLGGQLLFSASDPRHGRELWRSDGTADGTQLVRDLATTPLGSPLAALPSLRGKAYFVATDAAGATGLWRSDGTPAGTAILRLLPAGARVWGATVVGNRIVFRLSSSGGFSEELWETNGFAGGTRQIARPADVTITSSLAFTPVGRRLLFRALITGWNTPALISYDTKTRRFSKLPGIAPGANEALVATRSAAYFQGYDRKHGLELWRTDGTIKGTVRVADTVKGRDGSAAPIGALADRVFFTTTPRAGTDPGRMYRQQLWSSAGTARTTRRIATVVPSQSDDTATVADPRPFTTPGPDGTLLFTSLDAKGRGPARLWASDGSRRGTRLLTDDVGDGAFAQGIVLGRRAWFTVGNRLWTSSGSAAGTKPITMPDIPQMAPRLTGVGHSVFFLGPVDRELWTIDGPRGTPHRVQDLWPGSGSSSPDNFMVTGTHLLFTADDGSTGQQLFGLALAK